MSLHSIELSSASLAFVAAVFLLVRSRRTRRARVAIAAIAVLALMPVVLLIAYVRLAPLQSPYELTQTPGTTVLDSRGVVLQRDAASGLRVPVRLQDVSPALIDATIAAEDQRFYSHPGIDPVAIGRALVSMPFHRSGASTMTQQLARRLYLQDGGGNVIERKTREALIALQLESHYSKDQLLELYLNNVYYGRGAYGIEAAARVYFGVSAGNLDVAQASLLAGLPQLPGIYGAAPDANAAQVRRSYVLDQMFRQGRLSPAVLVAAKQETLQVLPAPESAVGRHFVRHALDELQRLRPDLAGRSGLTIETTLDAGLQAESERLVQANLALLKDRTVGSAGVVVLDPKTGAVLTMVGSADFADSNAGQVNAALAPRQPGSALKPFLYLTALEHGFTAATPLLDIPTTFQTTTGPYTPLDFDRRFMGPVPLRVALASSLNVPAVRTLDALGLDAFLETAHRFGLRTLTDSEVYGLALTLGGGEVRLLYLTNAYAALANQGNLVQPYAIERVLDARGNVLYQHAAAVPQRVASAEEAYVIGDILSDAVARQPGFGNATSLDLPFTAAVKTGTTTEFHDNWALGYTPERAVGVWAGNADNTPMRDVSGIDGAGPIWRAVMQLAMQGIAPTWPLPPAGLVRASVCTPTGLLPGPDCPSRTDEWFIAGTQPVQTEAYYARDASGALVIDPPAEARAWAAGAGLALKDGASQSPRTFVVQPSPGTVLYISPELNSQTYLISGSPPAGSTGVEFSMDGVVVGWAPAAQPSVVWKLSPGRHHLQVRALLPDGSAVTAVSDFEVRS